MKKLVYLSVLLLIALSAGAQTQSFEFYYIAHDRTTPVSELCDRLELVYETAMSYDDYAVIFYFPNSVQPIIVKMNLPGDNRADFKTILYELRTKSMHEIEVDVDYNNIMNLVNTHDFVDADGNPMFSSALFCWYVNPSFWLYKYNEELIARLYFNLELDKYKGYVDTQIWHSKDDGMSVDSAYPFGRKNLCRNMGFMLLQY